MKKHPKNKPPRSQKQRRRHDTGDIRPSVPSDSPGGHPEVFLDEVAGDGQRQEGDEEDGGHVGDDAQGGHTQQGGAGEALQGGGDVLVDRVGVCGKPVEDAAERSRLKQSGGMKNSEGSDNQSSGSHLDLII